VAVDLSGKAHINTFMVTQLIGEISRMEDYNMKAMQRNRLNYAVQNMQNDFKEPIDKDIAIYQHTPFYSNEHPEYDLYKKDFDAIDYSKPHREWKPKYYKHFFGLSDKNKTKFNAARKSICINYLESLKFSFEYYVSGVPSWTWYYQYRVAPLASDLSYTINSITDIDTEILLEIDEPFTPLELLMFVIPPQKSYLLPAKLAELMTEPKSPLIQYYPTSFIVDAVGGEKLIYSDPILPDIDKDIMLSVVRPVIKTLDETDKKRNLLNYTHTVSK